MEFLNIAKFTMEIASMGLWKTISRITKRLKWFFSILFFMAFRKVVQGKFQCGLVR